GVEADMARWRMQQGDGIGMGIALVDQPANDISAVVAKEQRVQYMYLAIGRNALTCVFGDKAPELMYGPAQSPARVGGQVVEWRCQAKVGNQPDQRLVRTFGRGVINAIRGQLAVQVLGGDGRPHEQKVIM